VTNIDKRREESDSERKELFVNEQGHVIGEVPISHPAVDYLRMGRIPHIWCPGCGIGTLASCFIAGVKKLDIDRDKMVVVSGIGCTGRIAGYLNFDSFHTTHGRAIPFATGLKLANPELQVVVIAGDGDLTAIGGNHLIHAARRNVNITVILNDNLIYGMTGGQVAPTTPRGAKASTMPFGNYDPVFNIPKLLEAAGASFVARWTAFHVRQLTKSIQEAVQKQGFSLIEVISPCTTLYARKNKLGEGLDLMKFYKSNSKVDHKANLDDLTIEYQKQIICGKFVDRDAPSYIDRYNEHMQQTFGEKFTPYPPK